MPSAVRRVGREARATARAQTMLALAEATGIDTDALAFIAHRFDRHALLLDASEPAQRAELEWLMSANFDELATVYKRLRTMVERGGEA